MQENINKPFILLGNNIWSLNDEKVYNWNRSRMYLQRTRAGIISWIINLFMPNGKFSPTKPWFWQDCGVDGYCAGHNNSDSDIDGDL